MGVSIGLCVRVGGAPTGDDALAMSLERVFPVDIQWIYLISDLTVLAASLTYIPGSKIVYSLLTVILSGQVIGLMQKVRFPFCESSFCAEKSIEEKGIEEKWCVSYNRINERGIRRLQRMKKILLIATGGTIASKYTEYGLKPQISAEELLKYVPDAAGFCEIDAVEPFSLDSTNVCAAHWVELAKLIEQKYEYYDGFVVCHGTDTMAYTAAALSYLIQNNRKPIVVTGAQKPIDLAITDARMNLMDSLPICSASAGAWYGDRIWWESHCRNPGEKGIF